MRRLSESLTALIMISEDLVRRPHSALSTLPLLFAEAAAEIRRADQMPCDDIRTTRAGIIMTTAIEGLFAEPNNYWKWQMVIGAMLPLLRDDAFQALHNEKAAACGEGYRR